MRKATLSIYFATWWCHECHMLPLCVSESRCVYLVVWWMYSFQWPFSRSLSVLGFVGPPTPTPWASIMVPSPPRLWGIAVGSLYVVSPRSPWLCTWIGLRGAGGVEEGTLSARGPGVTRLSLDTWNVGARWHWHGKSSLWVTSLILSMILKGPM